MLGKQLPSLQVKYHGYSCYTIQNQRPSPRSLHFKRLSMIINFHDHRELSYKILHHAKISLLYEDSRRVYIDTGSRVLIDTKQEAIAIAQSWHMAV